MVVVDGFKHPAEVEEFRVKQRHFILLGIDAEVESRWKRMQVRRRPGDPKSRSDFDKQDRINNGSDAAPHGQQVAQLLRDPDLVGVLNNGRVKQFLKRVDKVVADTLFASPRKGK